MDLFERLKGHGIVPVVKIEDADDALGLADALIAGGLPVAEVTFRTDSAAEAIARIAGGKTEMLIGAGTVLSVDQARQATDAGAKFIVSPGLNPAVVRWCQQEGVPILPGVTTPTEIETAWSFGLTHVKYFPAQAFGGLATLKALSGPYGMMRWIPTGGINASNLADYLSFDKVVACGGSWMAASKMIASQKFDDIAELTRQAVAIAAGARSAD